MVLKKVVSLSLAAIMACSLVGCSKSEDSTGSSEKVQISVGSWPDKNKKPEQYERYMQNKAKFEEKYPNIEIVPDSWNFAVDTFLTKAASNTLPTLFYLPFTEVDKVISAGYAADVTEYMKEYGYTDNMREDLLDIVTRDGKIYMLPYKAYNMGLVVNKKLFKEAGLVDGEGYVTFPQTLDEMAQMAGKIKGKTGKAGFIMPTMNNSGGWHFTNIAWAFGAEFMKNEDGKWTATFDSPECVAALNYVKDLKWKYNALSDNLFIDNTEGKKMLSTYQGAMYFSALDSSLLNNLVVQNGMAKEDIAVGQLPEGEAGQFSLTGGSLYSFAPNSTPEQLDAAFKWIKEIYGVTSDVDEEGKQTIYDSIMEDKENGIPIIPKVAFNIWKGGTKYETENQYRSEMTDVDYKDYEQYYNYAGEIKSEEPVNAQELYTILDSCLQEVISNKDADSEALLKDAAQRFQNDYLNNAN